MVVIGGVIPAQDYDYLYEHGACSYFWTRHHYTCLR